MRLAGLVVAGVLVAFAQSVHAQRWGIGVARMYSHMQDGLDPWPPGTAPGSFASRTEMAVGATYRVGIARRLTLQPELWYTTKGSAGNGSEPRATLTYLELPLTLRFGGLPPGRSGVRPVVATGASPALLLQCIWRPDATSPTTSCKDPASQFPTRRTDLGWMLGLGAEIRSSCAGVLAVDVRSTWGLRDIEASQRNYTRSMWSWGFFGTFMPDRRSCQRT